MDATFVGHPLADLPAPSISRAEYAAKYSLDPQKPWIALMPGSRVKEVRMNLPVIVETAVALGAGYEFLLPVAATLDRHFLQSMIGQASIRMVDEALPALFHSRAGIIASGTATVEAAMMGTPFVMVYRVSPLTYWLGKPRVKVPYFAMVNLIAGRQVVPELVQDDFSSGKVLSQLRPLLEDGPARREMVKGLAEVKAKLQGPGRGKVQATERAAEAILRMLSTQAGEGAVGT